MERWYKFDWSVKWWHIKVNILWSNWALGLLFDAGRGGFYPPVKEQGLMILLPLMVITLRWRRKM